MTAQAAEIARPAIASPRPSYRIWIWHSATMAKMTLKPTIPKKLSTNDAMAKLLVERTGAAYGPGVG